MLLKRMIAKFDATTNFNLNLLKVMNVTHLRAIAAGKMNPTATAAVAPVN